MHKAKVPKRYGQSGFSWRTVGRIVVILAFFATCIIMVVRKKLIFGGVAGFACFFDFIANLSSFTSIISFFKGESACRNNRRKVSWSAIIVLLLAFALTAVRQYLTTPSTVADSESTGAPANQVVLETAPQNSEIMDNATESEDRFKEDIPLEDTTPKDNEPPDLDNPSPSDPEEIAELFPDGAVTPEDGIESLTSVIVFSASRGSHEITESLSIEYPEKFDSTIFDEIKEAVGTWEQEPSSEINGDPDFCYLVRTARNIEENPGNGRLTLEEINEIILYREKALALHKTRDLYKLLSNDYQKRGMCKRAAGDATGAYADFLQAIEYRSCHIRMATSLDDVYGPACYLIGILYQSIGDIKGLAEEFRIHSFILSARFLEEAYSTLAPTHDRRFDSIYYAAFAQHKLMLIAKNRNSQYAKPYAEAALNDYIYSQSFVRQGSAQWARTEKYIQQISSYEMTDN